MKTESELRQAIETLIVFDAKGDTTSPDGAHWIAGPNHDREIRALLWVLGEYPPPPRERPAPDPHIAQSMGPGGFAVRSFPNMRVPVVDVTKKKPDGE